MRDENQNSSVVLLSFLVGGLVGAGIALLYAPRSGRETREKIKEFTGEVKDKVYDYADKAKGKVTGVVEEGKELYEEKKSLMKAAIEAGKEAYEKERERLSKKQAV